MRACDARDCPTVATTTRPRPGVRVPETLYLCGGHAALLDQENPMRTRGTCRWPECDKVDHAGSFCARHLSRILSMGVSGSREARALGDHKVVLLARRWETEHPTTKPEPKIPATTSAPKATAKGRSTKATGGGLSTDGGSVSVPAGPVGAGDLPSQSEAADRPGGTDAGDAECAAPSGRVESPAPLTFRDRVVLALAPADAEEVAAGHMTDADEAALLEHIASLREAAEKSEGRQQQISAIHETVNGGEGNQSDLPALIYYIIEARNGLVTEKAAARIALDDMPCAQAPDCDTLEQRIRYAASAWRSEREEASHLAALCQQAHDVLNEAGDRTEGTPAHRIHALSGSRVKMRWALDAITDLCRGQVITPGIDWTEPEQVAGWVRDLVGLIDSRERRLTALRDNADLLLWVRGALRGVDVALVSAEEQVHAHEVAGGIAGTLAAVRVVLERLETEVSR